MEQRPQKIGKIKKQQPSKIGENLRNPSNLITVYYRRRLRVILSKDID